MIGIYALYWEKQDLIYIGQAQNIYSRYKEHLLLLKREAHTNYKVQKAHNLYGEPSLYIIEECTIEKLNTLEILWQKEFTSINSLDIVYAGQVGYGANSNSSKYSKYTILKVFSLLSKTTKTHKEISNILGVPIHLVHDISRGNSHLWLKDTYSDRYLSMKTLNIKRRITNKATHGKLYGCKQIISPTKEIYTITSLVDFVKAVPHHYTNEHNFKKGIGRVLDGSRKQYKGWFLLKNAELVQ